MIVLPSFITAARNLPVNLTQTSGVRQASWVTSVIPYRRQPRLTYSRFQIREKERPKEKGGKAKVRSHQDGQPPTRYSFSIYIERMLVVRCTIHEGAGMYQCTLRWRNGERLQYVGSEGGFGFEADEYPSINLHAASKRVTA